MRSCFLVLAACASSPAPRAVPTPELARGPHTACPAPTPAIAAVVAKLDADADELHLDQTPAVQALAALGVPGGCAVLDALASNDVMTRLHAERVLEGVLSQRHDFRPGRGYPDQIAEEHVTTTLGIIDYHHDGTPEARALGAKRWRVWLEHPTATLDMGVDGPSADVMRAALDAVKPALVACGEPVDLTVTFDGSSGRIESIWGTASTDATYRTCLENATKTVALQPFGRARIWTRYLW